MRVVQLAPAGIEGDVVDGAHVGRDERSRQTVSPESSTRTAQRALPARAWWIYIQRS
jgi:hypothetical protein